MKNLSKTRVAVLGAGKIGTILLQAMFDKQLLTPKNVHGTVQHSEKLRGLRKDLGITASTDNVAAVRGADIVLICVKPQTVAQVLEQVASVITRKQVMISVAA